MSVGPPYCMINDVMYKTLAAVVALSLVACAGGEAGRDGSSDSSGSGAEVEFVTSCFGGDYLVTKYTDGTWESQCSATMFGREYTGHGNVDCGVSRTEGEAVSSASFEMLTPNRAARTLQIHGQPASTTSSDCAAVDLD